MSGDEIRIVGDEPGPVTDDVVAALHSGGCPVTIADQPDCPHPEASRQVVSDVVIYVGTRNDSEGAHDYETARQILACHNCGAFLEQRDIDRPPSW